MSLKDHVADDIPFQLIRFVHKRESTSKELFLSNILLIYVHMYAEFSEDKTRNCL